MPSVIFEGVEYRLYDHLYAVSRAGDVLRAFVRAELTVHTGGLVAGRQRLVHRMVATCWCDRPEGARVVHHVNHDKTDNRAENLEWVANQSAHIMAHHHDISRGHRMTEEGKARLRTLRLGSTASEATKQKQREATLRLGLRPPPRAIGTKMGEQALRRMRENSPNAVACEIDGARYASFSAAGKALGERPHTLRKRCLSKNFPSYRLGERSI